MKEFEGKTVFLLPTGNAAKLSNSTKILSAEIIKVSKVMVTICIDGRDEEKLRPCPSGKNELKRDSNSGYAVYESEQIALDHIESARLAKLIASSIHYWGDLQHHSPAILSQVATLLDIDSSK